MRLPSVYPPEASSQPNSHNQAAIVAQIAITGLSLDSLSQTHWVARACFVLSLTFALMAVYYATTQQRTLGRLLNAKDVRLWIRGGKRQSEDGRIVPSFQDILMKSVLKPRHTLPNGPRQDSEAEGFDPGAQVPPERPLNPALSLGGVLVMIRTIKAHRMGAELPPSRSILQFRFDFVPSDPDDYTLPSHVIDIRRNIIYHCFTPSAACVITISAPQMLLSSSLAMLLIALAIYFGFTWTRKLDTNAGLNDSRNIFITYIVGLTIAGLVYGVSKLFQNDEKRSELQIVEGYLDEYLAKHPEARTRWRLDSPQLEDGIELADMGREESEHNTGAQNA